MNDEYTNNAIIIMQHHFDAEEVGNYFMQAGTKLLWKFVPP